MDGGSLDIALKRIAASVARIEAASKLVREAGGEARARNDRLRGAVRDALRELDALIGDGPPGSDA